MEEMPGSGAFKTSLPNDDVDVLSCLKELTTDLNVTWRIEGRLLC